MKRAFTLIELLVVIAIMAMLGTMSVGGYRAMQRGMEDRGAMQNINQFIRSAYQRAQIDRIPVQVYFWNETIREETDSEPMIVVGRAVAVRRAGRLSRVQGDLLFDEFGDLAASRLMLDEDEDEEASTQSGSTQEGNGMYLYCMDESSSGGKFSRSVVSQTTKKPSGQVEPLLDGTSVGKDMEAYAYVVMDKGGCNWKAGSAYGLEFAEIQLPHNFIFGSSYSQRVNSPVQEIDVLRFSVSGNSGAGSTAGVSGTSTILISALRPDASGNLAAQRVAVSDSPVRSLNNR